MSAPSVRLQATFVVLILIAACDPVAEPSQAIGGGSAGEGAATGSQVGNTQAQPSGGAGTAASPAAIGSAGAPAGQSPGPASRGGAGSGAAANTGTGASGGTASSGLAGGPSNTVVAGSSSVGACPSGQAAMPEVCDGIDNDCDGKVDEMLTMECGSSNMGMCHKGEQTCTAGQWSQCVGAVEPGAEICDAGNLDENCDGAPNEGCDCTSGMSMPCGKVGGICRQGMQECVDGHLSGCMGAVDPQPQEICDGALDEDCDNRVDEDCECTNGAREMCMPAGACAPGMRTCGNGRWSACTGAVVCTMGKVCNNAQCADCVDGDTRACGRSLPSPCKQGTQTCRGGRWETGCSGEKGPTSDICNGMDDNCDGVVDNGCPSGQQCASSGATTMACSAPLPSGSYRNTCTGCIYDGSTLSCERCQGANSQRTTLQRCASGQTIANCDGLLSCRDPWSKVMQGSFYQTCTGCSYVDCELRCEHCTGANNEMPSASTKEFPCPGGISNCIGHLQCGPC
jgi:hypothetical protein